MPRKRSAGSVLVKHTCHESKRQQMYLDLGQKNFGSIPCPECGMPYQRGVEEEEQAHKIYHHRFMSTEVVFPGWQNERVVKRFGANERVIVVLPTDPRHHRKRVEAVTKIMDNELGCSLEDKPSWTKCFLFIMDRRVVGCVLAEGITQAYPVLTNEEVVQMLKKEEASVAEGSLQLEKVHGKSHQLDSAAVYMSPIPLPALVGISRLWVSSNHRRKKIATRMLDCVRHRFVQGKEVPKNLIAFSQPSLDGKRFAEAYCQSTNFLVWA